MVGYVVPKHMATHAFMLAAPSSGHGKTIITSAMLRFLTRKNYSVQAFKAGPDYIDGGYHNIATQHQACAQNSINLDPFSMSDDMIKSLFHHFAHDKDIAVIEGVMGLFDAPLNSAPTSARVAEILDIPIILIMDARHSGQSLRAIYNGLKNYYPNIRIIGAFINRVRSSKHQQMIEEVFTDSDFCLFIEDKEYFSFPSRHLGLVQAIEQEKLNESLNDMAAYFEQTFSIQQFNNLWQKTACVFNKPCSIKPENLPFFSLYQHKKNFTIAIAKDKAFQFIYAHLLYLWQQAGVHIVYFSPLNNEPIPHEADALFLPGGYPELYADILSKANIFMQSLQAWWQQKRFIYAECGGFMVLGAKIITPQGTAYNMANLAPYISDISITNTKKLTLGMRTISWHHATTAQNPIFSQNTILYGHEYHKSQLQNAQTCTTITAKDSAQNTIAMPMLINQHCIASYFHFIA